MEHAFLEFILAIVVIIVAAKLGGFISTRFNQPSVLGELLAGLLLGPTAFDMLHSWTFLFHDSEMLAELITIMAELGVILLMLLAGLELHLPDLLHAGKVSALSGILGVLVPLGLGFGTAVLFGAGSQEALFLGLTLAATSVSISAQTLMELNVLRSRVGLALLGAAVFDDILVILVLSISFVLVGDSAGGLNSVLLTIVKMIGYIGVAVALGFWVIPWLAHKINKLPISKGTLAFVLVICLLFSYAAEVIGGMAAITGAFLAGLFLGRTPYKEEIEEGISAMAYAFFVPIFFVNIGLEVDLTAISGNAWWFAAVFTIIAVVSKIGGSGLGAKMAGFTNRESFQLGIGMVSRGEVGLIVASFALVEGLISQAYFSIAVFMVIIATLVTPLMLRASFADRSQVAGSTPSHTS
ncbi:MAG: cation:proton antiporter [Ardenticatenaceae bacterium]|nr:cation:proton antiporter [Anaerolineales bacterium]MCB9006308.1 cation:proton antiporter [Ardenticatenaceae bacterium]